MKLLLFHGRGLLSSLIRLQTRSQYSHAAVLFDNNLMVESWQGTGVRDKQWATVVDREGIDAFEIAGINHDSALKAREWCMQQIGKKYDYYAVIRFVTRTRPIGDPVHRWFCSELAFMAFQMAGVDLLKRVPPERVSPGLLSMSPLLKPVNL